MFPIGLVGKTTYRPYATFGLIALNFIVFLFQVVMGLQGEEAQTTFYTTYALSLCNLGTDSVFVLGRNGVVSLFLHASLTHVFFNMVILWLFGPRVEEYFGQRRFLTFYIIVGMAAHIAQALFGMPACDPSLPAGGGIMVGASGAIAGVMGAFLFLNPGARVRTALIFFRIPFGVTTVSAWFYLSYWFVMDLLHGVGILTSAGIGHWAHIGGFVCGFAFLFVATLFKPAPAVNPFESLDG